MFMHLTLVPSVNFALLTMMQISGLRTLASAVSVSLKMAPTEMSGSTHGRSQVAGYWRHLCVWGTDRYCEIRTPW
jgi:hypothetical protein